MSIVEKRSQVVDQCLELLGEYYDTAQIICTVHEPPTGTFCCKRGTGNAYARGESCREFVAEVDQQMIAPFIKPED